MVVCPNTSALPKHPPDVLKRSRGGLYVSSERLCTREGKSQGNTRVGSVNMSKTKARAVDQTEIGGRG